MLDVQEMVKRLVFLSKDTISAVCGYQRFRVT
jgi:hypothetical protein